MAFVGNKNLSRGNNWKSDSPFSRFGKENLLSIRRNKSTLEGGRSPEDQQRFNQQRGYRLFHPLGNQQTPTR